MNPLDEMAEGYVLAEKATLDTYEYYTETDQDPTEGLATCEQGRQVDFLMFTFAGFMIGVCLTIALLVLISGAKKARSKKPKLLSSNVWA